MNNESINNLIKNEESLILYITTPQCNVCKVLKPKIKQLIIDKFPKLKFHEINAENRPEISAQLSVFTVPTILVFFNGAEHHRKSRYINLNELEEALNRPYNLLFE